MIDINRPIATVFGRPAEIIRAYVNIAGQPSPCHVVLVESATHPGAYRTRVYLQDGTPALKKLAECRGNYLINTPLEFHVGADYVDRVGNRWRVVNVDRPDKCFPVAAVRIYSDGSCGGTVHWRAHNGRGTATSLLSDDLIAEFSQEMYA